ncbi:hypothetical protein K4A83_18460 [Spirulina subsalsa FACHB-351]|uniref:Uncharacterized protein n=1 Tax=Spirulina subsalsa FACHB-351 TaxID=234711 RepID=A0ABT3L9P8_9CYAN|nr:hypothetical protein [Spirulina subsalsa]MCW6038240.1 hypothetical protein [Spirulina subsalsa FACHB-351]
MLFLVVGFNVLLALVNFYVAWKIWRLGRSLAEATKVMTSLERTIHNIFYPAPMVIIKGQVGTRVFREACARWGYQVGQVERILRLLTGLPRLWRRGLGVYRRRR